MCTYLLKRLMDHSSCKWKALEKVDLFCKGISKNEKHQSHCNVPYMKILCGFLNMSKATGDGKEGFNIVKVFLMESVSGKGSVGNKDVGVSNSRMCHCKASGCQKVNIISRH